MYANTTVKALNSGRCSFVILIFCLLPDPSMPNVSNIAMAKSNNSIIGSCINPKLNTGIPTYKNKKAVITKMIMVNDFFMVLSVLYIGRNIVTMLQEYFNILKFRFQNLKKAQYIIVFQIFNMICIKLINNFSTIRCLFSHRVVKSITYL